MHLQFPQIVKPFGPEELRALRKGHYLTIWAQLMDLGDLIFLLIALGVFAYMKNSEPQNHKKSLGWKRPLETI